jgi:hypothetical protein
VRGGAAFRELQDQETDREIKEARKVILTNLLKSQSREGIRVRRGTSMEKRSVVPADSERVNKEGMSRNRQTMYSGSLVSLPEINPNHRSSYYQSISSKNDNVKVYKEEYERRKDLDNI